MFKSTIRLVILVAAIMVVPLAWADDVEDIYQVDVVLFEHLDPKRFDAEVWPKTVGNLKTAGAIKLGKIKSGPSNDAMEIMETLDALDEAGDESVRKIIKASVSPVTQEKMLLNEEANIIKNSKNFRFIQQVAWTQPMTANVKATPVLINAGQNGQEVAAVIDVKPVRNQFYINVDLIFNSEHGNKQSVNQFRVKQEFRTKKREIYYFDHPLVGMMIMVSPVILADQ